MIIYNQAFDLYHCIFRIMHLLNKFDQETTLEIDRVRIWDFYLLFPEKIHEIRLKKSESDIRKIRNNYIKPTGNPYERIVENRKIFEKLQQYQFSALNCIASYGIINKESLAFDRISIENKGVLNDYIQKVDELSAKEHNVISLLTSHFYQISLFGADGLKDRTHLIESKYDA